MSKRTQDLALDAIVYDSSIYPRAKHSVSTIDRYAEAMRAGDEFPPMIIEHETHRLLDGKHRLEAYRKIERKSAPVEIHTVPDGVPAKLYAASLSARHGDRLSNADLKQVVRDIYAADDTLSQKRVAQLLGVNEGTVSTFVSDILARRREERASKALRLSLLGWTQAQIAERLGVDERTLRRIGQNFESKDLSGLLDSGHTDDDIGLRSGLPVQLVKALRYQHAKFDDTARLSDLDIKLQPYDVWQFASCHDLMGDTHPGRIPGQLLAHVLYFYTKQGDLVVDPMAGSGTTLDACLLMGRKGRGYDIDDRHDRIDIETHALDAGWPETISKANLIFWDPPYYKKKDASVDGADGYIDGSVSNLGRAEYLQFFNDRLREARAQVKPGTMLAFLMSDWEDENWSGKPGDGDSIFVWDYADVISGAGWTLRRHIQAPLSTQQVHPDIVNKFREKRRLARLERYLLVAQA